MRRIHILGFGAARDFATASRVGWIIALGLMGSTTLTAQQRIDTSGRGLQSSGPLNSSAWVARSHRPPAAELACTDFSSLFWAVSLIRGLAQATELPLRRHVDALPFQIAAGPDREGNRYVEAVPDGWIVGFDHGEFGGGLWWFSSNGAESRRIRPDASERSDQNHNDLPENAVGLPVVGGERFVLMGLDHLMDRSGRIFRLVHDTTGWRIDPVAVLDAEPDVWFVDGDRLRQYVLNLDQSKGSWRETWLTPAACLKVEMRSGRCECVG